MRALAHCKPAGPCTHYDDVVDASSLKVIANEIIRD